MAYPYPEEMRERVRALDAEGLSRRKIAQELGIAETTVLRWLHPRYHEQQKRRARERKRARRHPCPDCGKPIWYTSKRCTVCTGIYQRAHRYWTRERIISAIQEWARIHGRPPTSGQWIRASATHPAATVIYGVRNPEFRSWADAIEAAGFTTRRGIGRGNSRWTNEEAIELRERGLTDREIGRRFGVTSSAIGQRLGPRSQRIPVAKQRTREQRIADLKKAIEKGEQDGHRHRKGNDHHRASDRAGAKR